MGPADDKSRRKAKRNKSGTVETAKIADLKGRKAIKKPAASPTASAGSDGDRSQRVGKPVISPVALRSPASVQNGEASVAKGVPLLYVGIGASAGGLDAYERFFRNMPPDSGMAFILIPHLDPTHVTHMPELMQRATPMPVHLVHDSMAVRPNNVYIIPPDWLMGILHGQLHLVRRIEVPGNVSTINYFMRTLAEDQGEKAVCIILSGMGADGSEAVPVIKNEMGMVMAQEPNSAKYASMPKAVIDTGLADFALPPEQMPAQLLGYAGRPDRSKRAGLAESDQVLEALDKVFIVLRSVTGHDFSSYKRNTIFRRIQRRMAAHQLETLQAYVQLLSDSKDEAKKLLEELLIGVTRFFRDPEAFEALKEKALIPLLRQAPRDYGVRVWIPGCSGGEEPYSIAMMLRECYDEIGREFPTQVFATDIDSYAIEKARVGLYPESIAEDVGKVRLEKYFVKEGHAYRIKPAIRQMLVFAPQNVIKDPPFTKLDLLCCRNLLIYFDTELQKRLLPLFHYSLNPNGVLFLGTSETVGSLSDYFTILDKKWKIYRRHHGMADPPLRLDLRVSPARIAAVESVQREPRAPQLVRAVERSLMQEFAPPSAVVDAKGMVVFIHGRTGLYLEPAAGAANWNIVEMAREGLKLPLSGALRKANATKKEVLLERVAVKSNGGHVTIDVLVRPMSGVNTSDLFMVVFEAPKAAAAPAAQLPKDRRGSATAIRELEQELERTREHLQTSVEELETSNEELRSINEEYQSTNEELQSSNEELNTSREEMQSLNEELETVNAEYQTQLQQAIAEQAESINVLESLQLPVIVIDTTLRIKRFTSAATRIVNIIPSDAGRPLTDIAHRLAYTRLADDAGEVLSSLMPKLVEAESIDGVIYRIVLRPLRAFGNTIGGVVITFIDYSEQRNAEQRLTEVNQRLVESQRLSDEMLDTLREGLLILDQDLRVIRANRTFYDIFRTDRDRTQSQYVYELGNRQWDIPELRKLLEEILPKRTIITNYPVAHDFPGIGRRTMMLNARQLYQSDGAGPMILLAIEDVTERKTIKPEAGGPRGE